MWPSRPPSLSPSLSFASHHPLPVPISHPSLSPTPPAHAGPGQDPADDLHAGVPEGVPRHLWPSHHPRAPHHARCVPPRSLSPSVLPRPSPNLASIHLTAPLDPLPLPAAQATGATSSSASARRSACAGSMATRTPAWSSFAMSSSRAHSTFSSLPLRWPPRRKPRSNAFPGSSSSSTRRTDSRTRTPCWRDMRASFDRATAFSSLGHRYR